MWGSLKKMFGRSEPAPSPDMERWIISQAETVTTLVKLQLKEKALSPSHVWRTNRAALLGYTCGMTEHLCAKLDIRKNAPGVALMALAGVMEREVTFDEIMDSCVSLQQGQDVAYTAAHKIGWHDFGTVSPAGLPIGLVALLR